MGLKYRPEIDGLRAVAVISVMLFHAGLNFFNGGYIGVDVFFVISGFLISSIIIEELKVSKFSFSHFYERRARRILPALFFIMLVCIPFSWFWMSPIQFKEFVKSVFSAHFFVSNFFFWLKSDYFGGDAELFPLLHTWSLSVEEQYYLIFPPFLVLCIKYFKNRYIFILSLCMGISFFYTQFGGNFHLSNPHSEPVWRWFSDNNATFYLIFSRAWELLIGVFVAYHIQKRRVYSSGVNQVLSISGLVLIIYSILFYNEETPFPSVYTLVPTLGTALVIIFAKPHTFVKKILSFKWLVTIGLMSYSLYLWHYPLFSFTKIRSLNPVQDWIYLILLPCAFLLAFLTWKYIEAPFRDKNRISTSQLIISLSALGTTTVATCIIAVSILNSNPRYSIEEMAAITPNTVPSYNCTWVSMAPDFQERTMCFFGDQSASETIMLYGDSHAFTLLSPLHDSFISKGIKGVFIIAKRDTTCMVVPFLYNEYSSTESVNYCSNWNESFLKVIREINPSRLILASRWTYQLYPVPKFIESQYFDNGEGGVENHKTHKSYAFENDEFVIGVSAKVNAVTRFIKGLAKTGIPLIITYPIPEMGWNIPNRNFKLLLNMGSIPDVISVSYDAYQQRNSFVHMALDNVGKQSNITRIYPSIILCDTFIKERCIGQIGGIPLYFDDDHLSAAGAKIITEKIMEEIK